MVGIKKMFKIVESQKWEECQNCKEAYISQEIKKGKCRASQGNARMEWFRPDNDLNPTPMPKCVLDLTPVEKSCITTVCPLSVVSKEMSTASKGHCISFFHNVNKFSIHLPRLPAELPYIIPKNPLEPNTDKNFQIRRDVSCSRLPLGQSSHMPGSQAYMSSKNDITEMDKNRLRYEAVRDNPDLIDFYFDKWLDLLLKHIYSKMGA